MWSRGFLSWMHRNSSFRRFPLLFIYILIIMCLPAGVGLADYQRRQARSQGEIQMKNKLVLFGFSLLLVLVISILPGSQVNKVSAGIAGCVLGPHHGTIAASETWCKSNNPHLVDNSVSVPVGVTLTIEPGTVVKFYSGAGLAVAGSLIADGTATTGEQILFTSNLPSPGQGSWPGISASSSSTLQVSYCEMAYAGQAGFDYGSLTVRTASASLSHCRIHDGLGTALFLDNPGITPQFNDVEIDHYSGIGLYQNNVSMNPSYQNIRLHDNAWDGLQISGGTTDRDVTLDGSLAAFNGTPIYINNSIKVNEGTAMTITPGTTLMVNGGIAVPSAARLVAEGTLAALIIFTSWEEVPQPGDWAGISAGFGATLQLSYCELAYAGKPGFDFGSLTIRTGDATVSHCRIHDGSGTALYLDNPGITSQFNDVEIDHYTGAGLYQNKISMQPIYQDIRLHDTATNELILPGGLTDRDITLDGSPAAFNGAPIYMGYGFTVAGGTTVTITPGTTLKNNEGILMAAGATLVAEGMPAAPIIFTAIADPPVAGSWGGISAASGSTLMLSYCELAYAGKAGGAFGAVQIETSNAMVNQCCIHDSFSHGIYIKAATPFPIWNNVLTDNDGAALDVESGSHLQALHTTLARNQVGLYVSGGSATLTNTIVANNPIGVQQAYAGSIILANTLFQDNANAIVGVVTDTNHINGVAAFEADGYHLTNTSAAIDAAIDAWVNDDLAVWIGIPELKAWPGAYRNPVLFLDGDPDAGSLVSAEAAAYNLGHYPWARRVEMKRLDHSLGLWDDPGLVVDEIRRFFDGLPPVS
jgi:hypothetical protein